jgi:hypothetical protein
MPLAMSFGPGVSRRPEGPTLRRDTSKLTTLGAWRARGIAPYTPPIKTCDAPVSKARKTVGGSWVQFKPLGTAPPLTLILCRTRQRRLADSAPPTNGGEEIPLSRVRERTHDLAVANRAPEPGPLILTFCRTRQRRLADSAPPNDGGEGTAFVPLSLLEGRGFTTLRAWSRVRVLPKTSNGTPDEVRAPLPTSVW